MSEIRFTDLPLSETMFAALADMGYVHPTPVQHSGIPMVSTGQDLMVQSQTGTGKTAAFSIPLIEKLDPKAKGIRALILAPTRELAKQVAEETNLLGKYNNIRAVAVYGGASFEKQVAEAKFAQIIAGTPGRVLDHLRRRTLNLDKLNTLILDEADEMLSMGFARELGQIMSFVPTERQTLLFSATIPEDVKRYAKRYMKEPEFLSLVEENVGADDVEHVYFMVSGVGRPKDLVRVIEFEAPESAIVFTNTRKDSELVARYLQRHGFDAEFLNGDMSQRDRERIMKRAKDKNLRFLVATDVAARGIDISELSHVINYILPESPEVYIHRTGRTGRAGSKGTAVSLIGPREIGVYYYLKRLYNVALVERTVPTQAEIDLRREEQRTQDLVQEIVDAVGPVDETLRAQTMRLLERDDAVEVVQALLHAFRRGGGKAPLKVGGILEDAPKPARIEPGSRAQTLQGLADRVAIVQSEFRGLPGGRKARPKRQPRDQAPIAVQAPTPQRAPTPPPARAVAPEPSSAPPAAVEPSSAPPAVVAPESSAPPAAAAPESSAPPEAAAYESSAPPAAGAYESSAPPAAAAPESSAPPAAQDGPDTVKLFVNLGRRDTTADEAELREALAELAGLWPEDLVGLDIRGRHSYVEVLTEYADDLIQAVNGETLRGKTLRVEPARE